MLTEIETETLLKILEILPIEQLYYRIIDIFSLIRMCLHTKELV